MAAKRKLKIVERQRTPSHPPRLVSRDREEQIITIGRKPAIISDLYVRLLASSWPRLGLIVTLTYIIINVVFAVIYVMMGDAIDNARPGSFVDAFFFSVQTMATIGYGQMTPKGDVANILVTVEALLGFVFIAVMTGLVFSKFSQPTARVMFSEKAVISEFNGIPHLMMRLANERSNRIVNARVQLVLFKDEVSKEGHKMRRFYDLKLVRKQVPLLRITWTVMHEIDKNSPLKNMSKEDLEKVQAEIIVSLTGMDETISQTIHARYSYIPAEIAFDSVFEDILHRESGRLEVHYHHFHDVKPAPDK